MPEIFKFHKTNIFVHITHTCTQHTYGTYNKTH